MSGADTLQSLARGLAAMRSLGASQAGLTISEVAAQAAITRAGARRILLTLVDLRYVRQDGRRFHLTPEVLNLGIRLFGGAPFWGVAEGAVKDLCLQVNETVSVGVLDGTDVVYVLRHNPPRLLNLGIRAGFRLPAYSPRLDRHRVVVRELEEVGAGKDERRNTRALHDRREPQAAVIANRKT